MPARTLKSDAARREIPAVLVQTGATGSSLRQRLSRIHRMLRAGWTILSGLPQHFSQKGNGLPSLPHRMHEQGRLLLTSGITPTNYYRYRLYRNGISADEKAMFLGFFDGWRWLLAVNGLKTSVLTSDKLITSRLLHSCGIPHPACLGVFGLPKGFLDRPNPEQTRNEFSEFLSAPNRQNFFLKPIYGGRGFGHISVGQCLKDGSEWELLPRKTSITAADLTTRIVEAREPYLAQERMVPHPGLSCFGSDVLHTIRFITVLDGEVQIAQAAMKIAIGDLPVDNYLKGNALAGINLDSGVLGPGYSVAESGPLMLPRLSNSHPRTNSRIEGQELPLWNETLQVVKQAASCFHLNSVLAWDIAVTEQGPIVIEANSDPDWLLTQVANDEGLLGTALGNYLHRHGHLNKVGAGIGLTAIYQRRLNRAGNRVSAR